MGVGELGGFGVGVGPGVGVGVRAPGVGVGCTPGRGVGVGDVVGEAPGWTAPTGLRPGPEPRLSVASFPNGSHAG